MNDKDIIHLIHRYYPKGAVYPNEDLYYLLKEIFEDDPRHILDLCDITYKWFPSLANTYVRIYDKKDHYSVFFPNVSMEYFKSRFPIQDNEMNKEIERDSFARAVYKIADKLFEEGYKIYKALGVKNDAFVKDGDESFVIIPRDRWVELMRMEQESRFFQKG